MCFSRHVNEGAIAVIPQEVVVRMLAGGLSLARGAVNQVDVLEAVVVIVNETGALAVHFGQVLAFLVATGNLIGQPRLSGNVGEKALGRLSGSRSAARGLQQTYTAGGSKYKRPHSNRTLSCQLTRSCLTHAGPL